MARLDNITIFMILAIILAFCLILLNAGLQLSQARRSAEYCDEAYGEEYFARSLDHEYYNCCVEGSVYWTHHGYQKSEIHCKPGGKY